MEEDQKCKTCGPTGWKPSTRREFIQNAGIAGAGLAAALTLGSMPVPAYAGGGGGYAYTGICGDLYHSCMDNCKTAESELNWIERIECRLGCDTAYWACKTQQMVDHVVDVVKRAKDWVVDHIGEIVIGTIIVIGVIALVVVAWPLIVAIGEGAVLASGGAAVGTTVTGVVFGLVIK